MKLSRYNQFILKESKEDIDSICRRYNIHDYTINKDGSIDVNGEVYLSNLEFTELPLKFNKVSGNFYCLGNKLTTLLGSPKSVGGYFTCSSNKLTSLEGCPELIGGYFGCEKNQINSLKGFPEDYEGDIYIIGNPVYEVVKLFPFKRHDKAIYWLNEFDVIRDGKQVILDRLEEVFAQMKLPIPKEFKFNDYEII